MEKEKEKKVDIRKDVPVLLLIIAILMFIGGASYILIGIPLILLLGFGLIPIAIGALLIYYGTMILKLKKSAYLASIILGVLSLLEAVRSARFWHIVLGVLLIAIIHNHKDLLVNE